MKTCEKCAFKNKKVCKNNVKNCKKFANIKYSCIYCIYIIQCKKLNKKVNRNVICFNFKKSKVKLKLDLDPIENINFSPVNIVEDIIKTNYNSDIVDLVDDRDIPRPRNLVEATVGKKFINFRPYPKQLRDLIYITSSYCPYCSNTEFLKNVEKNEKLGNIIDSVKLYSHGICPKCKISKYEAVNKGDLKFYSQAVGIAGQRSGKSALIAAIAAAVTMYYLVKFRKPSNHYKILDDWVLHGTFVGLRYMDAYDQLWTPYYKFITKRPWFKQYNAFLKEKSKELGVRLFKLNDGSVTYIFKGITFYPSGPDMRTLRGRTRIYYSIDEICWFTGSDGSIKFNPDQIYKALDNSLLTIKVAAKKLLKKHPDTLPSYGCNISSPRSRNDMGMRLYRQSKIEGNDIYGFKSSTWEYNPNIDRSDLNTEFAMDPEGAKCNYGADPPFSSSPYIGSPGTIVNMFSDKQNLLKISKMLKVRGSLNEKFVYPKVRILKTHKHPSILSIDCGYSNNSFALTLLHRTVNKIIVTALLEIIPDNYPLSFTKIYRKVISKIINQFNVKLVAFDRWESINLSQSIYDDFGIDTIRYSVTLDDFNDLKSDILSGNVAIPSNEIELEDILSLDSSIKDVVFNKPSTHLFLQLINSVNNGKTIVKGDEMTDDLLRTLALGYSLMLDENYDYLFFNSEDYETNNDINIKDLMCVIPKNQNTAVNNSSLGCIVKR